jgi:hypothetical protein
VIRFDNMTVTMVCTPEGDPLPPIVNMPNGPFASGSQPVYRGQLFDNGGHGMDIANLATFTLTIADTLTGEIINSVNHVDILNTGRGLIDDGGAFIVTLMTADTLMNEVPGAPQVQRSLVLEWTTKDVPPETGRHQADFILLRLAV